jgi:hypothetical protein
MTFLWKFHVIFVPERHFCGVSPGVSVRSFHLWWRSVSRKLNFRDTHLWKKEKGDHDIYMFIMKMRSTTSEMFLIALALVVPLVWITMRSKKRRKSSFIRGGMQGNFSLALLDSFTCSNSLFMSTASNKTFLPLTGVLSVSLCTAETRRIRASPTYC